MPNCIILRGLPGSGKSTLARSLYPAYSTCSADFYFALGGEYIFDPSRLHEAHEWCFERFCFAVENKVNICLDNTNTTKKEYQRYVDHAFGNGYRISILTVETTLSDEELAKRNVHGVPVETIKRMRTRMYANT